MFKFSNRLALCYAANIFDSGRAGDAGRIQYGIGDGVLDTFNHGCGAGR